MTLSRFIATVCCVGRLRPAPGTWGSLAALPMAWAIHALGGPWLLIAATVISFFKGWWATDRETRGQDDHDPSEIVVDELVGQWVALWPVSVGAWAAGTDILALWPGWIAAFLGFRIFDILKPGPVGWADRRGDALGVMLDDVIAGLFAAGVVVGLAGLSHGIGAL